MNLHPGARTALVLLGLAGIAACATQMRVGADPPKAKERRRPQAADAALGDAAATRPGAGKRPNLLVKERSPYLREHAFDPVDWRPWGAAAFAEAKKRDVPLFVSSGYSTCHWCHVMHRESFEDEECAAKLNAHFVCVKVDREELPDVDDSLIRIAEAFQGSAGWPCTVFFLPDGRPFYAGTYWPKNALVEILGNVSSMWADAEKRKSMADDAKSVLDHLAKHGADTGERAKLERKILHGGVRAFAEIFDKAEGGFRKAPKFPCAPELSFLLAHSHSDVSRQMAVFTLGKIVAGGIHDHLGGGFHRYATDEKWGVPHFEKTLYDQALLVDALVDAYAVTNEKVFADAVRSTCEYVLRDLRLPSGGFASAEDADSSGAEGLFYTWTRGEVEVALEPSLAKFACARFGIEPAGKGPVDGRSVLHLAKPIAEAAGPGADGPALERAAVAALSSARATRVRPPRDGKVLAGWNGLMIAALARASVALDEPRWLAAAKDAARLVSTKLFSKDGRLLRRIMDGEARFPGALEDHGYLARAYVELYQASLDPGWLERAQALLAKAKALYWDGSRFVSRAKDAESLATSAGESIYEGATPSPAALLAIADIRIAVLTGKDPELARKQLETVSASLEKHPVAAPTSLAALDLLLAEPVEIVISGRPGPATDALVRAARTRRAANTVIALVDGTERTAKLLGEVAKGREPADAPRAFVCVGKTCHLPVSDPEALTALLAKLAR